MPALSPSSSTLSAAHGLAAVIFNTRRDHITLLSAPTRARLFQGRPQHCDCLHTRYRPCAYVSALFLTSAAPALPREAKAGTGSAGVPSRDTRLGQGLPVLHLDGSLEASRKKFVAGLTCRSSPLERYRGARYLAHHQSTSLSPASFYRALVPAGLQSVVLCFGATGVAYRLSFAGVACPEDTRLRQNTTTTTTTAARTLR